MLIITTPILTVESLIRRNNYYPQKVFLQNFWAAATQYNIIYGRGIIVIVALNNLFLADF